MEASSEMSEFCTASDALQWEVTLPVNAMRSCKQRLMCVFTPVKLCSSSQDIMGRAWNGSTEDSAAATTKPSTSTKTSWPKTSASRPLSKWDFHVFTTHRFHNSVGSWRSSSTASLLFCFCSENPHIFLPRLRSRLVFQTRLQIIEQTFSSIMDC